VHLSLRSPARAGLNAPPRPRPPGRQKSRRDPEARRRPPADREALIDTLLRVSQLVTEHGDQIDELDLNPLVVLPKGAKVVDALITKRSR
jgi:hypothetical protein